MQIAYILSVNSSIVSETGGTCSSDDCTVTSMHPPIKFLACAVRLGSPRSIGPCVDLASPTRGRISGSDWTAACLQTHLVYM
jgi:hypothetical protein